MIAVHSNKKSMSEHDESSIDTGVIVPNESSVTALEEFWPRRHCDNGGTAGNSFSCWERAGEDIGRHQYLQKLNFNDISAVDEDWDTTADEDWDSFMRGLANNRSIRTLEFVWCNGIWGRTFNTLAPFIEHNSNLSALTLIVSNRSVVASGEIRALSTIFRR